MEKIPLIVVAGPTASGKTRLAVEIAKRYSGEVVSADSMQIYKYMDIGTAKPTPQEMDGIPHHMLDIVNPDEPFSVAQYAHLARETIDSIHGRGRIPVLAGGTGLYIDHVVQGIRLAEMETDFSLRKRLSDEAKEKGGDFLYERLRRIDPQAAEAIHPNNIRRVIRALEVYEATGQTFTEQVKHSKEKERPYNDIMFMPDWDRAALYERIDRRVDSMMEDGLMDEFAQLVHMGYNKNLNAMQAIGYKELYDYHYGLCTLDEAAGLIKRHSRRYAKRQLTWFRRYPELIRLCAADDLEAQCFEKIDAWLKNV